MWPYEAIYADKILKLQLLSFYIEGEDSQESIAKIK